MKALWDCHSILISTAVYTRVVSNKLQYFIILFVALITSATKTLMYLVVIPYKYRLVTKNSMLLALYHK